MSHYTSYHAQQQKYWPGLIQFPDLWWLKTQQVLFPNSEPEAPRLVKQIAKASISFHQPNMFFSFHPSNSSCLRYTCPNIVRALSWRTITWVERLSFWQQLLKGFWAMMTLAIN